MNERISAIKSYSYSDVSKLQNAIKILFGNWITGTCCCNNDVDDDYDDDEGCTSTR